MRKKGKAVKFRRRDKKKVSRLQVREGMNSGYSGSEWNLPEPKSKKLKKIIVKPKSNKTKKGKKKVTALEDKRKAYKKYINSKEWKTFRKSIIKDRGEFCEDCGVPTRELHLHHLNYDNFGHELSTDVQLLCVPCHEKPEKHPWRK